MELEWVYESPTFRTLDVNAGGPAMSTYYTLSGLRGQGVDAQIIMHQLNESGKL